MYKQSNIVRSITRIIFPFIIMFGFYIILHGVSSPGGGFQGGVIVGAAYILFYLGMDSPEACKATPEIMIKIIESAGIFIFIGVGVVGVAMGYAFLANNAINFPPNVGFGSLLSGGTLFWINIGIGIHVAATVITIFYAFLERDVEESKEEKSIGHGAGM